MMRKAILIKSIGEMIDKTDIVLLPPSAKIQTIERRLIFALRPSSSLAFDDLFIDTVDESLASIRTKVVQASGKSVGERWHDEG